MYDNLIRLMKEKKITQAQLGAVIGKPRNATISARLTNGTDFTFEEACKIKDAFFPEYDIRFIFIKNPEEQIENV